MGKKKQTIKHRSDRKCPSAVVTLDKEKSNQIGAICPMAGRGEACRCLGGMGVEGEHYRQRAEQVQELLSRSGHPSSRNCRQPARLDWMSKRGEQPSWGQTRMGGQCVQTMLCFLGYFTSAWAFTQHEGPLGMPWSDSGFSISLTATVRAEELVACVTHRDRFGGLGKNSGLSWWWLRQGWELWRQWEGSDISCCQAFLNWHLAKITTWSIGF